MADAHETNRAVSSHVDCLLSGRRLGRQVDELRSVGVAPADAAVDHCQQAEEGGDAHQQQHDDEGQVHQPHKDHVDDEDHLVQGGQVSLDECYYGVDHGGQGDQGVQVL